MTPPLLRKNFEEIFRLLLQYLRHPTQEMKQLPSWTWRRLLVTHVGLVAVLSFLSSLLGILTQTGPDLSFWGFFFGTIAKAILTLITSFIATMFFFYSLQITAAKVVSFRKLFTNVFFAFVPFLLFQIFSDIFPSMSLLGFLFSSYLLGVGLAENFEIPQGLAWRLAGALALIFILLWLNGRRSSLSLPSSNSSRGSSVEAPEIQLGGSSSPSRR